MAKKLDYQIKHQSTRQIEEKAKKVLEMLGSNLDSDIIKNQGIDLSNNQYSNGETFLKEGLENLKFVCEKLINNLETVDKMGNFRQNFNSYFDQIIQWISSLQPSWQNIISYSDSLMQWLGQWGLLSNNLPTAKQVTEINTKIKNINDFEAKTFELEALKNELQIYKNAVNKLDQARNIMEYFDDKNNIETVNSLSDELLANQEKAKKLLEEAKNILGKSSDTLVKEFSELANKHSKNASLWLVGVFGSMILFVINITLAHFMFNGFPGITLPEISINRLDVRIWVLFLIFPAWFLLKNNLNYNKESKIFSFGNPKNAALYVVIPTILLFLLFSFLPEKIPKETIQSYEGLKIDTNSYYGLAVYILTRITTIFPSSLVLYFTSRYFGQNNMLKEEYEYKSVALNTFAGAIQKAINLNKDFDSEIVINTLLGKIYSYPRKNISKYPHDQNSAIDPINLKKIADNPDFIKTIVELLPKIKQFKSNSLINL
jgi:hypothetical protein